MSDQYIMFLDESGDHSLVKIDPQYPVFALVGCIFEAEYYKQIAVPKINELKQKHFESTDIILHSYEIRKFKNDFCSLYDMSKRKHFVEDMNQLLSELQFTVITSCIRKDHLNTVYKDPENPYDLAFHFIIERYVKFLSARKSVGTFCIESRDQKSNTDLFKVYDYFRGGSQFISSEVFQNTIGGMEFVEKSRNINGHQIADLVAYPIARYCLDKKSVTNPGWDIVKTKLRKMGHKYQGYGYKEFP